jgi:GTP-binding protein
MRDPRGIRNEVVIAHMYHGKSTPTDKVLREKSVDVAGIAQALNSNDMERDRGITIMSRVTGVTYNDYFINIVDSSGHGDFEAEEERVPSMVNSSLLIVDATEGSMTQTKFAKTKALALHNHPIVFLNNVDRDTTHPAEVEFEIFDLFASLDATDEQLDFTTVYASAERRVESCVSTDRPARVMTLLDKIIELVASPTVSRDEPFAMDVSLLSCDTYRGRVTPGRVCAEASRVGDTVHVVNCDERRRSDTKITYFMAARGLPNKELQVAGAGDIVSNTGVCDM